MLAIGESYLPKQFWATLKLHLLRAQKHFDMYRQEKVTIPESVDANQLFNINTIDNNADCGSDTNTTEPNFSYYRHNCYWHVDYGGMTLNKTPAWVNVVDNIL